VISKRFVEEDVEMGKLVRSCGAKSANREAYG
jgi:hypothetical protein